MNTVFVWVAVGHGQSTGLPVGFRVDGGSELDHAYDVPGPVLPKGNGVGWRRVAEIENIVVATDGSGAEEEARKEGGYDDR